ncbi:hypothetical protein [Gemmatimonas sp.]|jgi:hypothetical protein|uniref:hypothetical protein n=1 Tax=Gemmatimonas sp. TaxID=1962908 RepID=UPI00391D381F
MHSARVWFAVALTVGLFSGTVNAQPITPELPPLGGVWRGTLTNYPERAKAALVTVTMEIGAFPTADNQCVPWKTTYSERDTVRAVKDYRICRGSGPQDLVVDEGGGVRLQASLLGGVLVSAFKAGSILLVTHLRVTGNVLEEEILTIDDQPASEGLVTIRTRAVQRLRLERVVDQRL